MSDKEWIVESCVGWHCQCGNFYESAEEAMESYVADTNYWITVHHRAYRYSGEPNLVKAYVWRKVECPEEKRYDKSIDYCYWGVDVDDLEETRLIWEENNIDEEELFFRTCEGSGNVVLRKL